MATNRYIRTYHHGLEESPVHGPHPSRDTRFNDRAECTGRCAAATVVFGPSLTDLTNTTLTVAPFNTTLGQLTSIGLTLAASSNVTGTVTNTAAQANTFRISANTDVKLTSAPGTGIAGLTVSLGFAQDFTDLMR